MYEVIGKIDTRAFRVLWMLEELGEAYKWTKAGPRSAEELALTIASSPPSKGQRCEPPTPRMLPACREPSEPVRACTVHSIGADRLRAPKNVSNSLRTIGSGAPSGSPGVGSLATP